MKRNGPGHPKVLALASRLKMKRFEAVGVLELMWHFTAQYCPAGDIGKRTDAQICAAVDWPQERSGELIQALIEEGWLDRHPEHRLVVHDWHDHADGTCDKYLNDHGMKYATGRDTRRSKPCSDGSSRDKSRQVATSRDARAGARVPEPEPEPEPSPLPPSGGLGVVSSGSRFEVLYRRLEATGKLPAMTYESLAGWMRNAGDRADLAETQDAVVRMVCEVTGKTIGMPPTVMPRLIADAANPPDLKKGRCPESGGCGDDPTETARRRWAQQQKLREGDAA